MSETYWPLLGIYVFINFVVLVMTINSLQKSYKNWKSDLEWCNDSLVESPTWEYAIIKKNKARTKTTYYRRLKKACFWFSPILLLTLLPIYLIIFIVGAMSCSYRVYKE